MNKYIWHEASDKCSLCCLFIFPHRHYGLFIPSFLYYPSHESFCIYTGGLPLKYSSLKVILESQLGTTNLCTKTLTSTERGSFHCQDFEVPSPYGTQEKVTIVVQGVTSEDSTHQLSSKSVTLCMKHNGTFIQTDKAVYKPGQEVKFRIVKLNQDMEASDEMHPLIELQDPNNNCLAQWNDVVPNSGIVDLWFQLISEPTLGTYMIKTGSITHHFSVQEYVPPKFEVTIHTPKVISILDTNFQMSICGRYTYGQPVQGTVTFKICQKKGWSDRWGWRHSSEELTDLCYHHTAKNDHSGCLDSTVDLHKFKIRDSRFNRNLDIEASLEEEGTEIQINATTKKCDISSQITKILFKDTKSYFQPGAPFRGKFLLESVSGNPIGGKTVHLTISTKGDTIKKTYETDSDGEVSFQLSTSEWGKDSVSLRAFTDDSDEDYNRNYISAQYGSSNLDLEDIYVKSSDALYIRPVKSTSLCHENVIVHVDYYLGGQKNRDVDIFYLVLVGNRIVLSGHKTQRKADTDIHEEFPKPDEVLIERPFENVPFTPYEDVVHEEFQNPDDVLIKRSVRSIPMRPYEDGVHWNYDGVYRERPFENVPITPYEDVVREELPEPDEVWIERPFIEVPLQPTEELSLSGTLEISLPLRDISPDGKMLVFTVDEDGGVAADTTTFQVTPCLKQNATLEFSDNKVLPGSPVNMNLIAEPGSMCALRVVDQSVVLMNPEAELTADKILNLIKPDFSISSDETLDHSVCQVWYPRPHWHRHRFDPWPRPYYHSYPVKKKDIEKIIEGMGLTIVSNLGIVSPVTCKYEHEHDVMFLDHVHDSLMMEESAVVSGIASMHRPASAYPVFESLGEISEPAPYVLSATARKPEHMQIEDDVTIGEPIEDIPRTYLPDTWLWNLHPISSSGSEDIQVTAPHTITEWKGQMFCTGGKGLALSPDATLTVFKPFFVVLSLPYSMKRGESCELKASVFNYLSHALQLEVTLSDSEEFFLKDIDRKVHSFCLCAGEKKTVSWLMTPTKLGQVNITVSSQALSSEQLCGEQEIVLPEKGQSDTVTQSLLVEPEGTLVERTHNYLLICDGNPVEELVKLELPERYIEGSEKAFINVFRDLISSALNNLDNLLTMSSGCGEQNMVNFAPNVYILQYLKATQQLTPEISTKGCDFLTKGYQRQLSYKHEAGCYSAFGESDGEGSTWLTAFVMKSYSQAIDLIYIAEEHIRKGIKWLEDQQKPNGCFEATGRLLNNGLQGGVGDEESLTAYVLAAMMESGMSPDDPTVKKGFECMKNTSLDEASTYKIALMAYAYTLAGLSDSSTELNQKLDSKAVRADGIVYWAQASKLESDNLWPNPNSIDIEITSYVLLARMSAKDVSKKEIEDMVPTVRWLSKQQNANGGFCSTQDTVVALQAMAKFGSLTHTNGGSVTVTVTSQNGFQHHFHVDDSNRLVLQRASLPHIPGEYTVTTTGEGIVNVQVTQRYHIPPTEREEAFALSAVTLCTEKDLVEISMEFSYLGDRPGTNMVLLEVKMISGFAPQRESIEQIKKNPMVKRVESNDDSATIYIEEVTSQPQSLVLHAERWVAVSDLKPAILKIRDYYMPEEEKTINYLGDCP